MHTGFLLDFISKPVISGFTTAAALQISASQLKSLFRITGEFHTTYATLLTCECFRMYTHNMSTYTVKHTQTQLKSNIMLLFDPLQQKRLDGFW